MMRLLLRLLLLRLRRGRVGRVLRIRRRLRRRLGVVRRQIRVAEGVRGRRLRLRRVRLVLSQVLVVRRRVLERARTLGRLGHKTAIRPLGIRRARRRSWRRLRHSAGLRIASVMLLQVAYLYTTYHIRPLVLLAGDEGMPSGLLRRPARDRIQVQQALAEVDEGRSVVEFYCKMSKDTLREKPQHKPFSISF